ncbi:MAG: hypothetical protein RLY86_3765 [Pseudomonadota bacterium]|jgi:predicted nucleotidyltransferase
MPDALMQDPTLQLIVDRIVKAYDPERIYLFGSRARGDARPDSDYDLLMILPDDIGRTIHPFELYDAVKGLGVSVELIPATRTGFDSAKEYVGNLSHEAYTHGRLLYSAGA